MLQYISSFFYNHDLPSPPPSPPSTPSTSPSPSPSPPSPPPSLPLLTASSHVFLHNQCFITPQLLSHTANQLKHVEHIQCDHTYEHHQNTTKDATEKQSNKQNDTQNNNNNKQNDTQNNNHKQNNTRNNKQNSNNKKNANNKQHDNINNSNPNIGRSKNVTLQDMIHQTILNLKPTKTERRKTMQVRSLCSLHDEVFVELLQNVRLIM